MWVSLRLRAASDRSSAPSSAWPPAHTAPSSSTSPSDYVLTIFSFVVLSIPVVVLAVHVQNAGHRLELNLLGFTGDTRLLLHDGRDDAGLDSWSWNRAARTGCPPGPAVARADRRSPWRSTAGISATPCSTCSAATSSARRRPRVCRRPRASIETRIAHGAHPDGHVLRLRVRAAVRRRDVHGADFRLARHGRVSFRRFGDQERRELRGRRDAVRRRAGAHIAGASSPTSPAPPSTRASASDPLHGQLDRSRPDECQRRRPHAPSNT